MLSREGIAVPASPPSAYSRQTYRLKFHNLGKDIARDMEFEASGIFAALQFAARETAGRTAELWLDGKLLCLVKSLGGEAWQLSPFAGPTGN